MHKTWWLFFCCINTCSSGETCHCCSEVTRLIPVFMLIMECVTHFDYMDHRGAVKWFLMIDEVWGTEINNFTWVPAGRRRFYSSCRLSSPPSVTVTLGLFGLFAFCYTSDFHNSHKHAILEQTTVPTIRRVKVTFHIWIKCKRWRIFSIENAAEWC